MYIFNFYFFWISFTFLFGWIFNLDFNSFGNPLFYLLLIASIVIGLILSFIMQLVILSIYGEFRKGKDTLNMHNHRFGNSLLRLGLHLLRTKVIVSGKENIPEGKFVFVGNHQENYDIMVVKPIFKNHPLNFIGKQSLFTFPILGKWIVLLGNIPISKYADRSAAESIVKGIKEFKHGNPMGIFPEGKRSFSNEMIEFKPGALKLAMKPEADILIGTLYNLSKILKNYPFIKQKVYVHIHPLLKFEDYKHMSSQELSAFIKEIIQKQLNEFKKMRKN